MLQKLKGGERVDIEKIVKIRVQLREVEEILYRYYVHIEQAEVYKKEIKELIKVEKMLVDELKKIEIEPQQSKLNL